MSTTLIRDLVEVAALVAATAGAAVLFGPIALVAVGVGTIVALEVTDRG